MPKGASYDWQDRCWTLGRIKTVVGRRFHLICTIQGMRRLLMRNGRCCKIPACPAM
ncbi:winged helix-turn-helix domain-containing protein [Streptomyces sp. NPDC020490]|uniref:winged helix-turn-helix domain-containing protein n=1 Tax=Streptomyces sp. NPDC020490 TaxID=3365078 RepID=UPI003796F299